MNEENRVFVKKRWIFFWLTEAAGLLVYLALWLVLRRSSWLWMLVPTGTALIILSAIWLLYYYKLKYSVENNVLTADSGIIFRKRRILPPDNILWEMRLTSPLFRGTAIVVLHTPGGQIVIFGHYSTVSKSNG